MRKLLAASTLALVTLTACSAPEPATPATMREKLSAAVDLTLEETSVVTVLVNGETFAKGLVDPEQGSALTFVAGPTVLAVDDDVFMNPNSLASSLGLTPGVWVRITDRRYSPSTALDPLAMLKALQKLPVTQSRQGCYYPDGGRAVLVDQLSAAQQAAYTNTNPIHTEVCVADGRVVRALFDANNLAEAKTATLAFSFSYDEIKFPATPTETVSQDDVPALKPTASKPSGSHD
jgi:hypothetical protein